MKTEAELEAEHRKIAMSFGWFVEKVQAVARRGFPDRFYASNHPKHRCRYCNRGRVVLMEWKRSDGVLRKQQELRIEQLRRAGVEVHVVKSAVEANRILGISQRISDLEDGGWSDPDTGAEDI